MADHYSRRSGRDRSRKNHPSSKADPNLPFIEDDLYRHPIKKEICYTPEGRKMYQIFYNDGTIEQFFNENIITNPVYDLEFGWWDKERRKYSFKYDPVTKEKKTSNVVKRSRSSSPVSWGRCRQEDDCYPRPKAKETTYETVAETPCGQRYHYSLEYSGTKDKKKPSSSYPQTFYRSPRWIPQPGVPSNWNQSMNINPQVSWPMTTQEVPWSSYVPGTTKAIPGVMHISSTFVPDENCHPNYTIAPTQNHPCNMDWNSSWYKPTAPSMDY